MNSPLLTLTVPTYNRAAHLEQLLCCLQTELAGLESQVEVILSDNASTDDTPALCARFQAAYSACTVVRQPENIGPDRNFCSALERASGQYFWIVGDDDLPKQGVIRQLVAILAQQQPDLLYLQSEWVEKITGPTQGAALQPLVAQSATAAELARQLHVWFTFISSVVINREQFLRHSSVARVQESVGTSLIQLSWVYSLLEHGQHFLRIDQPCVLATAANTGGYKVLTTFGAQFPRLTAQLLAGRPELANSIVRRCALLFMPGLIWHVRFGFIGSFVHENPWPEIRAALGRYPEFWLILWPLGRLPRWPARQFLRLARLIAWGIKRADRLRAARP